MRFNDEYRNEMNSIKLSEDFIKDLAAKMAEEAGKSTAGNTSGDKAGTEETTETKTVTYRRNRTMTGIKITAAVAAAAAFAAVFSSVLNNLPEHNGNISISPASTEITSVTEPESTLNTDSAEQTAESSAAETSAPHAQGSTQAVTSAAESGNLTVTAEETSVLTPETQENQENEHDYSAYEVNAYEIFDAFNTADSMRVGYGIETSESSSFVLHVSDNEPDYTYISVTDQRFSSLSDIADYLNRYFTKNLISSRFDLLLTHRFHEQDGELYVTQIQTSFGYQWSSDEISFRDMTDTSFTMSRTYYDFGSESELVLHMVKSDSYPGWKIDSAEFIPA